ncbi:histidine phosphatase family protein [Kytococcus schroeteri]|uniref:histidine phosphatase family protein n=2 Tax=Kytococcus schroeteri TaxID=138300 RepID=UPI0015E02D2D|nr:histidine phosphatase family protein [Kytococcus schroeteri]
MTRTLLLQRHGRTADNAAGRYQGQADTPLDRTGREQARRAAPLLAGLRPDAVVSSDLARASATAREVGDLLGVGVLTDARLREVHMGQWQGRLRSELAGDPRWADTLAALRSGEDPRRGGTGETLAECVVRVGEAVEEHLRGIDEGGTLLVVGHGLSTRALVASRLGLTQSSLGPLGNTRWAQVTIGGSGWVLDAWNVGVEGV